jgi:hypothetical protein
MRIDISGGRVTINGQEVKPVSDPSPASPRVNVSRSFPAAKSLSVSYVPGQVDVQVGTGPMKVEVEGPEDLVKALCFDESAGHLSVSLPRPASASSNVSVVIDGVSINTSVTPAPQMLVRVTVPVGTPVALSRIDGTMTVGDTLAALEAHIQGAHSLEAGAVGDLNLTVQGSGRAEVRKSDGLNVLTVQGSGRARVMHGEASMVMATVQGSGRISHEGRAQQATVAAQGSGQVFLESVVSRPIVTVMGSARVVCGTWPGL